MKTLLKLILGLFVLVVLAAGGGLAYLSFAFPKAGPVPELKVEATPEKLARGAYLANHVTVCIDCHSTRDWSRFAGPIIPGTEGKGGEVFDHSMGLPGVIVARNITPAAVGGWTDGELLHAFTTGVSKDGRAMFPLMPYPNYGRMSEEDAHSIVAYLRSLKPVENDPPASKLDFPLNFIVKTIPVPAKFQKMPDTGNSIEYGRYVASIAGCADCHTPANQGTPVPGMEYAGGFEFGLPKGGVVRSLNITPNKATGIGEWTREAFIARFKTYANVDGLEKVEAGAFNTVMPWSMYAGMTEQDLGAIYDFLRTVKPVENKVERFSPPNKS